MKANRGQSCPNLGDQSLVGLYPIPCSMVPNLMVADADPKNGILKERSMMLGVPVGDD